MIFSQIVLINKMFASGNIRQNEIFEVDINQYTPDLDGQLIEPGKMNSLFL